MPLKRKVSDGDLVDSLAGTQTLNNIFKNVNIEFDCNTTNTL